MAIQSTGGHNRESLGASTSYARPITIGAGANRCLLLGVHNNRFQTEAQTGPLYDGLPMTLIGDSGTGIAGQAAIWYLLDPPVGTADFTITNPGNTNSGVWYWMVLDDVTSVDVADSAAFVDVSATTATPPATVGAGQLGFAIGGNYTYTGGGVLSGTTQIDSVYNGFCAGYREGAAPGLGTWGANQTTAFTAVVTMGASGPTPITFSGTIPTLNGTVGASFSEDLSGYFSGTETPFAYTVQSGTLPAGLTLNSSTGVISGTPTTAGTASGIVIRGTDATPDTDDSNSFSIVIAPAAATSMTIALKQSDGTTAAASITGIEVALLNAATLGAATAVLDTWTGESTDGSGNLVLDITGLGLTVGQVRYVVAGKSAGTVGADFDGWHGPATAA